MTRQETPQVVGIRDLGLLARSYDYILIGAGSAGCVVARRSVDAEATVLLVEAVPVKAYATEPCGGEHTSMARIKPDSIVKRWPTWPSARTAPARSRTT